MAALFPIATTLIPKAAPVVHQPSSGFFNKTNDLPPTISNKDMAILSYRKVMWFVGTIVPSQGTQKRCLHVYLQFTWPLCRTGTWMKEDLGEDEIDLNVLLFVINISHGDGNSCVNDRLPLWLWIQLTATCKPNLTLMHVSLRGINLMHKPNWMVYKSTEPETHGKCPLPQALMLC